MSQVQAISPCLWFTSLAEEAANFYVSVFPDSRIDERVRWPEGFFAPAGSVLTVRFTLAGQEFIALNGGQDFPFTEAVSLSVRCETQPELDFFWDSLGDGGSTGQCGWLKDRYGLSWQIVPTALTDILGGADRDRAARIMQAMMPMTKLDIATLLKAAG
ncbi:VOC family protein [Piscinibacter sakaiensis]|uniref:VOC family protein n=1 Tax=Piscinibacter sakaiensis TaxID=1547922 RepID=UPI003AAF7AB1